MAVAEVSTVAVVSTVEADFTADPASTADPVSVAVLAFTAARSLGAAPSSALALRPWSAVLSPPRTMLRVTITRRAPVTRSLRVTTPRLVATYPLPVTTLRVEAG
jgi:hypothetical protein